MHDWKLMWFNFSLITIRVKNFAHSLQNSKNKEKNYVEEGNIIQGNQGEINLNDNKKYETILNTFIRDSRERASEIVHLKEELEKKEATIRMMQDLLRFLNTKNGKKDQTNSITGKSN